MAAVVLVQVVSMVVERESIQQGERDYFKKTRIVMYLVFCISQFNTRYNIRDTKY